MEREEGKVRETERKRCMGGRKRDSDRSREREREIQRERVKKRVREGNRA